MPKSNSHNENNADWVSVHLYHPEPLNILLENVVAPLLDKLKLIAPKLSYFYIRYWEQGPHVRLRLQVHQQLDRILIMSIIEEYYNTYISSELAKRLINSTNIQGLEYIPYVQEIDRYGGKENMSICESHFQCSSDVSLLLISNSTKWNYDLALGIAIRLQFSFIYASNLSHEDILLFLKESIFQWLQAAHPHLANSSITKESYEFIEPLFEQSFRPQRNHIFRTINDLNAVLQTGKKTKSVWLNMWHHGNIRFFKKFNSNHKNNGGFTQKSWFVLQSLIHMSNNRLGILNRDEAFLSYIVLKYYSSKNAI